MKNILYIFSAIVVTLFSLTSCGLEEPINSAQKVDSDAFVEFVGRPVGFSNQEVTTKSTPNNLDNKVCNCYLLLFNSAGELVYITGGAATSIQSYRIPRDLTIEGNMTACYLVNIPKDFVNGIKTNGITLADLNTTVLDISYASYSSTMPMGVPLIDAEPCIPMYGELEFTATENTVLCQVPIKRLFAKVTIKMTMDLEDIGTLGGQRNTRFTLTSYTLSNLPTKVRLSEPTSQELSAGYETQYTSDGAYEYLQTYTVNKDIYNADAWGTNLNKSYSFDLYVPEYYLIPLTQEEFQEAHKNDEKFSTYKYNTQQCKPKMFASTKKPISVNLLGTYKQGTGSGTAGLNYDIYLGENNSSDFNLKRNKHYTNNVVITGIQNTELDCRVEVTDASNLISIYGEVANCYVISAAQDYSFKAYKGAYKYGQLTADKKCTGTTVEIIAQDKKGVTFADDKNPFTVREGDNGVKEISFTVTNISADCNMVIALMKDGKIEWSWHLWFIYGLKLGNQGFFQLGTQAMPDSKGDMIDNNLGIAREASFNANNWIGGAVTGFYYKYGHRAPYFTDVIINNGTRKYHGFNEDDYSPWNGGGKAPSDPCPPGYKVPSSDIWSGNATKQHASVLTFTAFRYWDNGTSSAWDGGLDYLLDDMYYPYSGYVNASGNIVTDQVYDTTPTSITADYTISFKTDEKPVGKVTDLGTVRYQDWSYFEYEYSQFKYNLNLLSTDYGYLWGGDCYLFYAYKSSSNCSGLQIESCRVRTRATTRTMKQTWSLFSGWSGWKESIIPATGDWSSYEPVQASQNDVLIDKDRTGSINNESWQEKLKSNQSNKRSSAADYIPFTPPIDGTAPDNAVGYQVRCAKE